MCQSLSLYLDQFSKPHNHKRSLTPSNGRERKQDLRAAAILKNIPHLHPSLLPPSNTTRTATSVGIFKQENWY